MADDTPPRINKWDSPTVKNTIDDEIRKILNDRAGWSEVHSLMNGRLVISFVAVLFSGVSIVYDYLHPFPKSKIVLAICSMSYFILMGILQLYQCYVERNTFYQAVEVTGSGQRFWRWNSDLPAYDDNYTLYAEYSTDGRSGKGSTTKSIANFIDDDGSIVRPRLRKEVLDLYNRLAKRE